VPVRLSKNFFGGGGADSAKTEIVLQIYNQRGKQKKLGPKCIIGGQGKEVSIFITMARAPRWKNHLRISQQRRERRERGQTNNDGGPHPLVSKTEWD